MWIAIMKDDSEGVDMSISTYRNARKNLKKVLSNDAFDDEVLSNVQYALNEY